MATMEEPAFERLHRNPVTYSESDDMLIFRAREQKERIAELFSQRSGNEEQSGSSDSSTTAFHSMSPTSIVDMMRKENNENVTYRYNSGIERILQRYRPSRTTVTSENSEKAGNSPRRNQKKVTFNEESMVAFNMEPTKVTASAGHSHNIFKFEEVQRDVFRPMLIKAYAPELWKYTIGGLYGARAYAVAQKTIESLEASKPHSLHYYFIRDINPELPITYHVQRISDGQSLSHRTVNAMQNEELVLILQSSFRTEKSSCIALHQLSRMPNVKKPEKLLNMKETVNYLLQKVEEGVISVPRAALERLESYHSLSDLENEDIFEIKCADIGNCFGFSENITPNNCFWIRPNIQIEKSEELHQWLLAFITDLHVLHTQSNGEASMILAGQCFWFHSSNIKVDEWMLYETNTSFTGSGFAYIDGKIWKRNGALLASCHQEYVPAL